MPIELTDRVAIVTGAGRGLGRAHALELARRGARVVINDIGGDVTGENRSTGAADAVVAEIHAAGGEALASYHDVADVDATEEMVAATLARFGRLDILVNNAGNLTHDPLVEIPPETFDATLKVHLYGAFNMCRAACPPMVEGGWGRIVMTTSQVGFFGKADSGAYAAAKMGLLGLMAALALEMAPHGVLVNAVSPFAYTRMAADAFPAALEPLLDPAQVAAVVAFLASEACTRSGDILVAGGGHFSAARMYESRGIDIENPADVTAETIAGRYREITDMTAPLTFPDAMEAVGATFAKLRRRAGLD